MKTPTLKYFIECLQTHDVLAECKFSPSAWLGSSQSSPSIIFPAAHETVGALTVYDDGDEVTVEIGELHHTHFSAYSYDDDTSEKRLQAATEDAAQFVADLFANRVYVSVDYADDRCIGSSHGYVESGSEATGLVRMLDAPLVGNEANRSERYLWSGPIDTRC